MVDKNLFLYDLAVVAIMKDEEPYVKEWLEYHLLAGADHFYLYDNDSTPEFRQILQPYIDAGIVTCISYPGKARQFEGYTDSVKNKFSCRYMSWIDGDEFIYPKTKSNITELVDEILLPNPHAGGLVANINNYGSNGQEKADYTQGVLDRFTRRAPNDWTPPIGGPGGIPGENARVSTIANPRRIAYFDDTHHAKYFLGSYSVNENGKYSVYMNQFPTISYPVSTEKIVMNHYHTKSYEEYVNKRSRGDATNTNGGGKYSDALFKYRDTNDEFDDGIVRYRNARRAQIESGGGGLPISYALNKSTTKDYSMR